MSCPDAERATSAPFVRGVMAHLRRVAPLPKGCRVRVVRAVGAPGDHASCSSPDGRQFVITIDPSLSPVATELLLIHEYSHALSWHDAAEDHDDTWGAWYADTYRRYYGVR